MWAKGELKVKGTSLDDWIKNEGITRVDILKLDIQGLEINALRGSTQSLCDGLVKTIVCEIMFNKCYQEQPLLSELMSEITDHGFILYNFFDNNYINGQLNQTDGLFFHESIIDSVLKAGSKHFHSYSKLLLD